MEKMASKMPASCKKRFFLYIKFVVAWVAQWIEQWFPKPLVAGSIPAPGTILFRSCSHEKAAGVFVYKGHKG